MTEEASAPCSRRIAVILNPKAGRGQGTRLREQLKRLLSEEALRAETGSSGRSFTWEIIETVSSGSGTRQAAQAVADGAEVVAAAGGDGTLGEVLNGIVGTGAMLGLLPLGTGNDCARYLGIGTDLERAVQTLLYGKPRRADLGYGQGRWFVNVAGCGFDAVVAERVNRGNRFLRGTAAYIAAVIQTLFTYRAAEMRLTLDGESRELQAMMCSIANTTSYGGGMLIAPDAEIDDGVFDICILLKAGRLEFLRAFPRVFRGTHVTHPKVRMLRAKHILIESKPALPILIDGDVFGTTPVEFTLHPGKIEIMAPSREGP